MPDLDFASLTSQASEMMDAGPVDSPIETGEAQPSQVESAEAQPAQPAPVVPVTPEAPLVTTDPELDPETHGDRMVRVKIDGQWETKPLKDVAAGYSRTSHFTRQMQDLATQRKEVEGFQTQFKTLQDERQQIQAFLKNPQLVYQFLQQSNPEMFARANQPVEGDPNEIATVQQARELVNQQSQQTLQRLQQLEHSLTERMGATARDIESRRETAVYIDSINSTVKEIFAKHPILNKVRMAEDIIRYEVAKMNPKSITEALDAFRSVADGIVDDLQDGYQTVNKTKLATAAKLTTARIEPPGGSGPQLQPTTSFKKADGSLDWKALKEAATNYAEA